MLWHNLNKINPTSFLIKIIKVKDKLWYSMMENNSFQRFRLKFLSRGLSERKLVISLKIQVFWLDHLKRKKEEVNSLINKHHKNIYQEKEIFIMVSMKFLYSTWKSAINQFWLVSSLLFLDWMKKEKYLFQLK